MMGAVKPGPLATVWSVEFVVTGKAAHTVACRSFLLDLWQIRKADGAQESNGLTAIGFHLRGEASSPSPSTSSPKGRTSLLNKEMIL